MTIERKCLCSTVSRQHVDRHRHEQITRGGVDVETDVAGRAVAKDGMDLPADQATVGPSLVQMGNGETYDFEFAPDAPGDIRLDINAAAGDLLVTMPIHVLAADGRT